MNKPKSNQLKTIPIPLELINTSNNITFNTNTTSESLKKQILEQATKFHSKGNIIEAEKCYLQLINSGFNDPRAFSNYGILLKNQGKLEQAESYYRKAIELKPDFAEAYSNLGIVLQDLGKLKTAEIYYHKAIELKPDFANANSNLGTLMIELGNLEEAELYTRKAIKLDPNLASAYSDMGIILKELGKLKEAEIAYRKAIELKPDFAQAHSNLGIVLTELGKLKEAKIAYDKAIEIKPNFAEALMNRSKYFFTNKEFELALKDADSCDTSISRVSALETLYKLGKVDEIFKRIEAISETYNDDIRLAAFSSFIAEKENRDTSHNFCRNPISFLYFSNLKYHHKNYDDLTTKIINELAEIKTIWEPSKNSTYNGFHSPSYINLFLNSSEYISHLKSIILSEIDSYYLKFEKESCSYIQKWPSKKELKAWHVILKKQGYQSAHIHPSGWLSGVVYLKVVPPLDKNEGAIEFSLNGENYFNINSPQSTYQPKLGDIVLFPSSLHHRTIPFSTNTDRIVIAFDLMPN
ncbi:hypothetical protein DNJ72_06925 [Prochlorococcus marinus XMU1403]|uniref:tetratricopeptide repeat protein n=1 Tax=Prochlorococcus marinus TaxID=1219 RepID=UPI000D940038|nr:tetratricopeptide repeat protein [Prochlorococcus marinus]MBW3049876.1 hypothetical protein [Prochlorococcus marinus str. MU1403]PYE00790.1 hypothetical protein DNJ72_06925 [Prochlorococcus marinus XMU1403]